ncbi:thermonuclease family protein [Sulfitobacter sp. HNIBRBA2951]|uniref:thermonuclease family protein n=1 Tax=Sulfitobacter aquimarinus TaxID=3158557 RepID=UPI0032DFD6F6
MEVLLILGIATGLYYVMSALVKSGTRRPPPPTRPSSPPARQFREIKKPQTSSEKTRVPEGYKDGDHLTRTNGVDHAEPPAFPLSMALEGPAYVIDGDTIVVSKIKIRLAGIDAPELDRPWGQKAKWEMVRICKGHVIRAELTGDTTYDRLVGTCYLPDGTDIGAEIVKAGLALDGGYYSEGKYRHLEPAGIRRKLKPHGNRIRS